MKLDVGMYVRTDTGKIGKIVNTEKGIGSLLYVLDVDLPNYAHIKQEFIKASHDIIDLIEVGDYVNGYKISGVYDDDGVVNEYNLKHKKCLGKNIYDEDYQEYLIYEEEIENIVTKEQMEAMQYKVV